MTVIRSLTKADLPEAQRIVRVAFGTFLGAPDPERFWSDLDYVYGSFGAEHTAASPRKTEAARSTGRISRRAGAGWAFFSGRPARAVVTSNSAQFGGDLERIEAELADETAGVAEK